MANVKVTAALCTDCINYLYTWPMMPNYNYLAIKPNFIGRYPKKERTVGLSDSNYVHLVNVANYYLFKLNSAPTELGQTA